MSGQSKYRMIYETLTAEIDNGSLRAGVKLPAEHELAGRFGVTRQTVLKALDILKIQGRITSQRGRGTFVAGAPLRSHRPAHAQRQLVLVCSNIQDSHGHRVFLGTERMAAKLGYSLITCNTRNDSTRETEYLRRTRDNGVDGILLLPYLDGSRELIGRIAAELPVVCIDNGFKDPALPLVTTDNFQGMYQAVSYLIDAGHRRIGIILSTLEIAAVSGSVSDRYRGYREALADHGIAFDPELVSELGPTLANARPRDIGLELYGYPAMARLINCPHRPTAVVVLWDEIAPGAYAAIRDARLRVPEDISVVGFNDDELCAYLSPPLTTVRQPGEAMGERAVELLDAKLRGEPVPENPEVIPCTLIRRESVCVVTP